MSNRIDHVGQSFGRLSVLKMDCISPYGQAKWLCLCECGKKCSVLGDNLRRGNQVSCGCRNREIAAISAKKRAKHGMYLTPTYKTWRSLKDRCLNPKATSYKSYGARGISLCAEWRDSFEAFLSDMGKRPSLGHSIDRINNDGDYTQNNCRWATRLQQQNNKRNNRKISWRGRVFTVAELARELGFTHSAVLKRIRLGWSVERITTEPLRSWPSASD